MYRPEDHPKPESAREPRPAGLTHALDSASRYFMGTAEVQKAARRIAARLDELQIPYATAGGLAVSAHGHVRVTADAWWTSAPGTPFGKPKTRRDGEVCATD